MRILFRSLASCHYWLLLAVTLCTAQAQAAGETAFGEAAAPLPVEQAFVPEITAAKRNQLRVSFAIADGYYLYRDKLSFTPNDNQSRIGEAELPAAIVVQDDFFGETSTYRNEVVINLPIDVPATHESVDLMVGFQGCADIGICYPPVTRSITVALPADTSSNIQQDATPNTASVPAKSSLKDLLGGSSSATSGEPELLSPEQAFVPVVLSATRDQITLQWQIEEGYYLYRDKLGFSLGNAGDAQIRESELDPGVMQNDAYFGDVAVYRHEANARLTVSPSIIGNTANLDIEYQGCADIGVCFPPQTLSVPLGLSDVLDTTDAKNVVAAATNTGGGSGSGTALVSTVAGNSTRVGGGAAANSAAASNTVASTANVSRTSIEPPAVSEQDRLTAQLVSGSLWLNAASFFVLGLLLAFTPCVLPMVPILSSLIVGQGEAMTTGRAFRLSVVYVLAMALTYTVVGVLVGLSGYNIQAWFQNPWILSVFAGLFVLLSLSMFGFYELQLPTALQNKLTSISNQQQGGRLTGVAVMGFLSALIVGPCVTAPLVGALVYIADTGDAVIGGVALFALSMGMGTPLLLIGASAGRLLPSAGVWMNATKQIFGILLLAMAIYMLSRFLPAEITMGLSAILAVISGIYLGATDTIDRNSSGWSRLGKGVGLVVSLYGIALMIGAMSGSNSFMTPLRGVVTAGGAGIVEEEHSLAFERVKSVQELQAVVAEASAAGQPVMLDFYADWCVSCKEMEAFTFTDEKVQQQLNNAILVQADVTKNDQQDQELLRHFGLFGPPAIIFYDAAGNEIRPARVVGFMPAERFSGHVAGFLNRSDA